MFVGPIVVFAGEANPALADIHNAAIGQLHAPRMAVDVETIAAVALQRAAVYGDVFRVFQKHRPAAMDRIVAHAGR